MSQEQQIANKPIMPPSTPTLPTYSTFMSNLTTLDPSTITETDYCIICRVPYICNSIFAQGYSRGQDLSNEEMIALANLRALSRLPFAVAVPQDFPVRLPCGHVFGSLCLREWFATGATSCPLDRLILFRGQEEDERGVGAAGAGAGAGAAAAGEIYPTPRDYWKYMVAIDRVRRLPMRKLIFDFKYWNEGEGGQVRISTSPMKRTLATFMIRVAFRIAKVGDWEILRVWYGEGHHGSGGADEEDGGGLRLCSTENMSIWPALVQLAGQSNGEYFSGLVRTLASGLKLWGDGKFPLAVRVLFREEMRRMYEVLCQEVERRYEDVVHAASLYEEFWTVVVEAWEECGMNGTGSWEKRELFPKLVLRAWISEERMLGVIRREMTEEFLQTF